MLRRKRKQLEKELRWTRWIQQALPEQMMDQGCKNDELLRIDESWMPPLPLPTLPAVIASRRDAFFEGISSRLARGSKKKPPLLDSNSGPQKRVPEAEPATDQQQAVPPTGKTIQEAPFPGGGSLLGNTIPFEPGMAFLRVSDESCEVVLAAPNREYLRLRSTTRPPRLIEVKHRIADITSSRRYCVGDRSQQVKRRQHAKYPPR